jgi:hypothetical protein
MVDFPIPGDTFQSTAASGFAASGYVMGTLTHKTKNTFTMLSSRLKENGHVK